MIAIVGGDDCMVDAHDREVVKTLAWIEGHADWTWMKDPETGRIRSRPHRP